MADFNTPFGDTGERRFPAEVESAEGHPCGPADRPLFNGLQYRVEAEIGNVISYAGIPMTNARMTQLREAIEFLISAATGGGDPSEYVLMSQARARLPIFPEVSNIDHRIVVTSPATGTVRIPGGVELVHRGIYIVTTAQTDLPTDPSKTYHLRWDVANGFRLRDLANAGYNPTALVEWNPIFDSKYDDAIIARISTNSSNIATITNLANLHRWNYQIDLTGVMDSSIPASSNNLNILHTYNMARTPTVALDHALRQWVAPVGADRDHDHLLRFKPEDGEGTAPHTPNRYGIALELFDDFSHGNFILRAVFNM